MLSLLGYIALSVFVLWVIVCFIAFGYCIYKISEEDR